jgi:NADPH:quinone reductase-like Zn-dependent oxidoreductase
MERREVKALTRNEYGGPEVLTLTEAAARQPRTGEVLLEVRAASLNAADLRLLRGTPHLARLYFGLFRPRFRVPGADVAGTVTAVGEGVERLKPGDAVVGDVSGSGFGALAEEVVAKADALALVPKGLDFEQAAALPMAAVSALQALTKKGRLESGETVLVTGASGGVGSFAVQIAKALGAHVTAVTNTSQLDTVRQLGADEVIDRGSEDFRTRSGSFDLVIETAARGRLKDTLAVLTPRGRLVMVGGDDAMTLAASLRGKAMFATPSRADLETVVAMVQAGTVRPLIGATYPLARGVEALTEFEGGRTRGKVVITVR